jgi:hypothetical protein
VGEIVVRTAACSCGALSARCEGEPVRVSVCHCLACQRRSGSAFAAQARFPEDAVTLTGEATAWVRVGDSGDKMTSRFCPRCGSTVYYTNEGLPGVIAIPLGAFADPGFPPPWVSVYEERKHPWTVVLGDGVEHLD